jgi:DNA-binding response OmpR family regulator
MKRIPTGITPFDERTGGLKAPGLYVLAGAPGSGKLAAVLQFLRTGLASGERVAFLTSLVPEQVFEQAQHLGFDLVGPFREGRLRLLGFGAEFDQLVLSAAEPGQVFDELSALVGPDTTRIGVDPGKPLWDTRAGTSLSNRFLGWGRSLEATALVTLSSDLADTQSPATEWVLQGATGVLKIERLPNGLRQLWVRRISPPIDQQGPVSLELVPGQGLCAPAGRFDRRRTDASIGSERRLLLLTLAERVPDELLGWARRQYDAFETNDPLRVVSRLQEGDAFGLVLVYLDRAHSGQAAEACRAIRPLTPAPIILATDDRLRATDRTQALDAGANDFLSDNFSLVELSSRIDRAWRTSIGLPSARRDDSAAPAVPQIVVVADEFARRVEERLADTRAVPFALIHARCRDPRDRTLGNVLVQHVRDAGDFVGAVTAGFAVVLQGARPRQAEGYLARVRQALAALPGGAPEIDVTVLSSATDAPAILEVVRSAAA